MSERQQLKSLVTVWESECEQTQTSDHLGGRMCLKQKHQKLKPEPGDVSWFNLLQDSHQVSLQTASMKLSERILHKHVPLLVLLSLQVFLFRVFVWALQSDTVTFGSLKRKRNKCLKNNSYHHQINSRWFHRLKLLSAACWFRLDSCWLSRLSRTQSTAETETPTRPLTSPKN